MTDKYAVIGNPVAHSKSPSIHAEFARQTDQDISYVALLAPREGMRETVLAFRGDGGRGMNVTLPFKHEAWALSTARVGDAEAAGAVNTLLFRGQDIIGHNTDGIGLLRDIRDNLGCTVEGRRMLLMGAGGASYGVMEPLLRERPQRIVVANRALDKAQRLVAHFSQKAAAVACVLTASSYAALTGQQFDLVVNATSAGLTNEMPPLHDDCFAVDALAYDMVYGDTPFLAFAEARGARAADGTGMLVEQAAESFFIWRGVRPATQPVIARIKQRM
jgi:shikimate dehydrogenase